MLEEEEKSRLLDCDLSLGERLRILRLRKGLTQNDLSDFAGVSQGALSKIERDHLPISREAAIGFAGALDLHPAVILFPELDGKIK